MTIHRQADLYYIILKELEKLPGDFTGHKFVVEVMNVAIDDKAFRDIVSQHFSRYEIEIIAGGFKITGEMNAEEMTDGQNDFSDEKKFLKKISDELLDKFKTLPGWGEIGGPDLTVAYNTQD